MSVIQQIRDKYAALVIALIALSLVAFILMDAFVGRGPGENPSGSTLGKVNGEKIDKGRFDNMVNLQQQGQQGAQKDQVVNAVWSQTVDDMVMEQEYEKLGLQMTTRELNDLLFGANPPQWMSQYFGDGQGNVDVAKAKQSFAALKKQKGGDAQNVNDALIVPTINNQLRTKYMALLSQSSYIPKWMAEKFIADQNAIARFSYVAVPYASISDSAVKVTDDDIRKYVDEHKSDFRQEETGRSISYVTFNAAPSSADSAAVLTQLQTLKNEFATATDVQSYLARVSTETPYFDGYVLGSQMQMPNADSIKSLADGQVFGPYLDGQNYVLAKMVGRRTMPDSVKVRHILIKTGEGGQTTLADSIAAVRIDSISRAIQAGADFNAMVLKYSDDQGSKATQGEYQFAAAQFSGLSREFAEVAFYGRTGDKKTVKVENSGYSGYHYIEVLDQKGIGPAYNVAYLSRPINASTETINTSSTAAGQFAATSRDRKAFEQNAKKSGLVPMIATDIKENDFSLNGVGENRSLVRWIYENKVGAVSEPFDLGDKYVVAMITSIDEKGVMSVAKARVTAEPFVRNEKKALMIIDTKFKNNPATLEAAAQATGQTVQVADSVSFAQPFIPSIGNEPKITGLAFNKGLQGKISAPIAGNTGVFVVKGESISAIPNAGINVDDQRRQMEMQQKQMGAYRAIEALRKAADIKDNRFDFY